MSQLLFWPNAYEVLSDDETNELSRLYTGTKEKTFSESSYHDDSQLKPYNPDDLYQKRGDHKIYEDMMFDDQVYAALQLKKDLVIGSGWEIVTEDEGDEEVKADLERALGEDPCRPFQDMLQEILSAYEFGWSMTEKVFMRRNDGSLSLKDLKTRHPDNWLIDTDVHGNVKSIENRGPNSSIIVDPKSVIHYINNPKFQNPYGSSDLRAAYQAYFTKQQITRYYAIFIEKAASPVPVAKYDKNAPPQARTDLFNSIKRFQNRTALVIPKEIEIEFLESKNNGDVFVKGINLFNLFIGRSILIPDLLGFSGSETSGGSFSLGENQMNMFFKHLNRRRETLEGIVNEHIVKPIVVANHGFVEHFPKFVLRPVKEEDVDSKARLWLEAVKGKAYKPNPEEINHFRELVNFPVGDVIESPEPQNPFNPFQPEDNPLPPQSDKEEPREEPDAKLPPQLDIEEAIQNGRFARPYNNPDGTFHRRVDFVMAKNLLDTFNQKLVRDSEQVFERMKADLFDQIERKKIIKNQRSDKIAELKPKFMKDLKQLFKTQFRGLFNESAAQAQSELIKGNFRTPLPSDQFLEFLENETFDFIGKYGFNITEAIAIELRKAIKDGTPLSAVLDNLDESLLGLSDTAIERFARTKFTDVMNRGRLQAFDDSGIVVGYQYSAILDDRTTAICRGLHGKFFKAGTEPIPPMHFNCRSLLIPITKFEEFNATTSIGGKSPDAFIEDNIGKGFPKR